MIGIINLGLGNLRNVEKMLEKCGASVVVSSDIEVLEKCKGLIFPGVGHFEYGMKQLKSRFDESQLKSLISKKPTLGICLGMQILFELSEESNNGDVTGLNLLPGCVRKIKSHLNVPHVGWNKIDSKESQSILFKNVPDGSYFYFTHSYSVISSSPEVVSSYCNYGHDIVASVEKNNIYGVQFHPEKSGELGEVIFNNFLSRIVK